MGDFHESAMIETLTTIMVLLSILALALIGLLVYLFVTGRDSTECRSCGGSGFTVVQGTAGLSRVRCPDCRR